MPPGSTFPNGNYPAGQYPNGQYPGNGQGPMSLIGQGSDGVMMINSSGGQQGVVGGIQSGCTPITGQIPLQGTMYLDSANIIAGQGVSGNSYAQGYLQLSQLYVQTIISRMGGYYGNQQVPCATIVGMNVGHYNTKIYGGYVLIMLNNNPGMTTQVYF